MSERKNLTTAHGICAGDNQNSITVGPRGPALIERFRLIEKLADFNRERIAERVAYAKVRSLTAFRNNSGHERSSYDE